MLARPGRLKTIKRNTWIYSTAMETMRKMTKRTIWTYSGRSWSGPKCWRECCCATPAGIQKARDTGVTPRQEDTKKAVPVASLTVVDVGPPIMKIGRKGKTPAVTQKAGLSTPTPPMAVEPGAPHERDDEKIVITVVTQNRE
jgi:hypothetical protein